MPDYDAFQHGAGSSGTATFGGRFGGTLKLLLTSGGVTNPSIHLALVQMLGVLATLGSFAESTDRRGTPGGSSRPSVLEQIDELEVLFSR